MNSIDSNSVGGIEILSEGEVDQVGGGIAPLVAYGLWMCGGAALSFGAAAVVHYFGNGKHSHGK